MASPFLRPPPTFRSAFPLSPLILADRLITLAQDADQAGYPDTANQLVTLVYAVLDGGAAPALWPRPVRQPTGQPGKLRRPGRAARPCQPQA